MNTPIPPTLPSSALFSNIQTSIFSKNNGSEIVDNTIVSNGYTTTKGNLTTIDGQDQTYSVAAICGSMIQRTGTTVSVSTDIMPLPSLIALELGLPEIDGASYVRMLGIYNPTNYNCLLTGTGWTFLGDDLIRGEQGYTLMLNITYTILSGWTITSMIVGEIDLD